MAFLCHPLCDTKEWRLGGSCECDTGRMYWFWAGHVGVMFGVVSHFFHCLQKKACGIVLPFLPQAHLPHQFSLVPDLLSLRCKTTPVYHTTSSTRSLAYQSICKLCTQKHQTTKDLHIKCCTVQLLNLFSPLFFVFVVSTIYLTMRSWI